jgi:ParB-like chromosome segregation protein Spo0J
MVVAQIKVHCAHTKLVPVEELKPHPRNPNQHPIEQIQLLANIVKQTGWRNAIVVSERSGFITKGHARYSAARLLQAKVAPVDYQKYASEEEELADMVSDNRIAELAERDDRMLRDLLASFPADKLELTGYTAADLRELQPINMDDAAAELEARLETLDLRPAPNIVWMLIGVPFDQWGKARSNIEALEKIAAVTCKTTRTD